MTIDETWLHRLETSYLLCRSMRHAWDLDRFRALTPEERDQVKAPPGTRQVIARDLHCLRCTAQRVDYFARTTMGKIDGTPFGKFRSHYKYPEGYTFVTKEREGDRPSMEDVHRETFRRFLDG